MYRNPLVMAPATAAALATVAACATNPKVYRGPIEVPRDEAFTCAVEEMNRMGYIVQIADREAGFVRAQRSTTGFLSLLLEGSRKHDAITFSTFESDEGDTEVRVTAAGYSRASYRTGRRERTETGPVRPDSETREDARRLYRRCGDRGT